MYTDYSVVLTVYEKENSVFFESSLLSILNQTKQSNDIIIVCDGPLTDKLNEVLNKFKHLENINIIRLETNHGSGYATQKGLENAKNEIVARMDSDDISLPNRMEVELDAINNGLDVVAGWISEFDSNPEEPYAVKQMPSGLDNIIKYSKKRNPFCNVTFMYKKSKILSIGGYADLMYSEDYTLGIKCLQANYKCDNLPMVLVNVRAGDSQIKRRGNKQVRKSIKGLRKYMLKTKYINVFQYLWYNLLTDAFCIMPGFFKKILYKRVLRK